MNRRDDDGSASVFVLGLVVAMMVLAGLVVDGGRAVDARATAADEAEQAARAGAQQLDLTRLRDTGDVRIDAPAAQDAARAFLADRGYDDVDVVADAERVVVTVRRQVPTQLLTLVFVDTIDVSGTATSQAVAGVTAPLGEGAP